MTEEVNSQNAAALNDMNNEGGCLTGATNLANMTTTDANLTEESKTPQIPVSASVIPTQRGIFSLKSKQQTSKDRFNQKAQDYLESYKMSIYLQDAIKIILERRDEKPLDLLNEYFNTTLRGEHILLREYAFVSATQLNRRSFLQ